MRERHGAANGFGADVEENKVFLALPWPLPGKFGQESVRVQARGRLSFVRHFKWRLDDHFSGMLVVVDLLGAWTRLHLMSLPILWLQLHSTFKASLYHFKRSWLTPKESWKP